MEVSRYRAACVGRWCEPRPRGGGWRRSGWPAGGAAVGQLAAQLAVQVTTSL